MKSIKSMLFAALGILAASAGLTVLYVRVGPKTGPESFFRCGEAFTHAWRRVEVDDATAQRLYEEQMLDVTGLMPEDFEPTQDELDAATTAQAQVEAEAEAAAAQARVKADTEAAAVSAAKTEADAQAAEAAAAKAKAEAAATGAPVAGAEPAAAPAAAPVAKAKR
jgi:hypothetical protein